MSLWLNLNIGTKTIGFMEIQRQEHLDLSDKAAIADVVSTYKVTVGDQLVGEVRHRYGDGAWTLLRLAVTLYDQVGSERKEAGK